MTYFWVVYRRTWKADVGSTLIAPVLYLASIGVGLGSLVGHGRPLASLGHEDYLSFLAPALLVTTTMQAAIGRATYEVWSGCNVWSGAYRSMQASPIGVTQIVTGHMAWLAVRLVIASAAYLVFSAAFGAVHSPDAIADLIVGPLVGLAFATPIAAYAVTARVDAPFSLIFRLLMMPLFLFSGTFFPISQLPVVARYVAYAFPLWHGVQLSRGLYRGDMGLAAGSGHVAYLVAVIVAGLMIAKRTYARRLAR